MNGIEGPFGYQRRGDLAEIRSVLKGSDLRNALAVYSTLTDMAGEQLRCRWQDRRMVRASQGEVAAASGVARKLMGRVVMSLEHVGVVQWFANPAPRKAGAFVLSEANDVRFNGPFDVPYGYNKQPPLMSLMGTANDHSLYRMGTSNGAARAGASMDDPKEGQEKNEIAAPRLRLATAATESSSTDPYDGETEMGDSLFDTPGPSQPKGTSPSLARAADEVLAHFNAVFGTRFTRQVWAPKIMRRMAEHPEVSVAEHCRVVDRNAAAPWWRGSPGPSVIWGNARVFEMALACDGRAKGAGVSGEAWHDGMDAWVARAEGSS